jgi:hypothetical protein
MRSHLINTVIACWLYVFSWAVAAEVKHVTPHGFIIENKVQTQQSLDKAWLALTQHVNQWWPSDHTWWGNSQFLSISAVAGGCFCEIDGERQAQHMQITFVEPKKLLRMSGGLGPLQGMGMHGALDWAFSTEEDKTIITLSYQVGGINQGGFEELAPIVDKVQRQQLNALKQFIDKH